MAKVTCSGWTGGPGQTHRLPNTLPLPVPKTGFFSNLPHGTGNSPIHISHETKVATRLGGSGPPVTVH